MKKWTELGFGKHKGKTLPQVIFSDPDWFFWAIENGVFSEYGGALAQEAKCLDVRARSLRIPQEPGEELKVSEYVVHPHAKKFVSLELVPASQELHQGSSAFRRNCIDLSIPRQISKYDKTGCKLLMSAVKKYVFGDTQKRITRRVAVEFFENDDNFELPHDCGAYVLRIFLLGGVSWIAAGVMLGTVFRRSRVAQ